MKETLESKFKDLDQARQNKLTRARECARLSIPGLLPDQGFSQNQELPIPYQSDLARMVTGLSAKLVSVMMPLNGVPFFGLSLNDSRVLQGEDPTPVKEELARRDRLIMDKLSTTNIRAAQYLAFQHLIVIGDCLWYQTPTYEFRVYRLDQYVVRRDPEGKPYEIILKEWVDVETLDDEIKSLIKEKPKATSSAKNTDRLEPMYCHIIKTVDKSGKIQWTVTKEIRDTEITSLGGSYDVLPYQPLLWTYVSGEDYGRSLLEENVGDARSLESLSRSLVEGAAANAEFRFGVDPHSTTQIDDLVDSENGEFVPASKDSVFPIQLNNVVQLEVTLSSKRDLLRSLGRSFLMDSAVQPTGDRVTAEQIRRLATELEQALGGVVSSLSRDINKSSVERTVYQMQKDGELETFELGDGKTVQIKIRTGLEALGREVEQSKLAILAQSLSTLPPEAVQSINWSVFLDRWLVSLGIESNGLVKTQEQIAQEQAAIQQQQMAQMAAQTGIQTAGKVVEKSASNNG